MKCNEAAAFRKTYDHIINRLKDEKNHFDVQLQQSMTTLKAKEADLAELVQMSTDAHRAKETAKGELARLEQTIAEERKIRQKELAERRKLVQAKIEVNQRMEQRERKRRELQLEAVGELNMDGEQNLIKNYVAQGFYSASAEHELQMQKDKVTAYEEHFRSFANRWFTHALQIFTDILVYVHSAHSQFAAQLAIYLTSPLCCTCAR